MKGFIRRAMEKKAKLHKRQKALQKMKEAQKKRDEEDNASNGDLSSDDEFDVSNDVLAKLLHKRYLVLKYLGKGSYSRVWLAHDFTNHKYVALKLFYPEDYEDSMDEIKIMKSLGNDNPGIVKMYETFDYCNDGEPKRSCIVYEFLGTSLLNVLSPYKNKLPMDQVKKLVKNILTAMNNYYQKNLIHADIKLENMMTRQYSSEINEVLAWFNQLDVDQQLLDSIAQDLPEDFTSFSASKKKKTRQKLRSRKLGTLVESLYDPIFNRLNELHALEVDMDKFDQAEAPEEQPDKPEPDEPDDKKKGLDEVEISKMLEVLKALDKPKKDADESDQAIAPEEKPDEPKPLDEAGLEKIDLEGLETPEVVSCQEETPLDPLPDLTVIFNDFGNACYNDDKYDGVIQHRAYRPPETVIGNGFCQESDLWGLGCIIYEIVTDRVLFPAEGESKLDRDRDHLALMYECLGHMPKKMTSECEDTFTLFGDEGNILKCDEIEPSSLENEIKKYRSDLSDQEVTEISSFIRLMLTYNPEERLNPTQLLQQEWLKPNDPTALHTIVAG